MEEGCIKGDRAILVAAKENGGRERKCLCKFITSDEAFNREMQIHGMLPENAPIPGEQSLPDLSNSCFNSRLKLTTYKLLLYYSSLVLHYCY